MKIIKKILLEMTPIILGILIALFVNDWKQDHDDSVFMEHIIASINQEMKINLEEFDIALAQKRRLVDSIEFYMKDESVSIIDIVLNADGLQVPHVKNTAWKALMNHRIELFDYDLINSLSDIQEVKELNNKKISNLMEFIQNHSEATDFKRKKMFMLQINILINGEEQLQELCTAYLEE